MRVGPPTHGKGKTLDESLLSGLTLVFCLLCGIVCLSNPAILLTFFDDLKSSSVSIFTLLAACRLFTSRPPKQPASTWTDGMIELWRQRSLWAYHGLESNALLAIPDLVPFK